MQCWGTWVAQSVKRPTSSQVMISWFMGLSPTSRSVLTAQSLEPASDSVSLSHCASPAHTLSLKINKINLKKIRKNCPFLLSLKKCMLKF